MQRELPTRRGPMFLGRNKGLKSSLKRKSKPSRVLSACRSSTEWNLKNRAIRSLGQAPFQIADAVRNVRKPLLLIAHLPLNAQGTAVADFLQGLNELTDVDLALTQRDFLAPVAWNGRPIGVLDMDAANIGAQDLDCSERVAFIIKQHVRRVEIDLQI